VQALFKQLFSFVNVQLFNQLLLRRECCSFSNGEYVKTGLAQVRRAPGGWTAGGDVPCTGPSHGMQRWWPWVTPFVDSPQHGLQQQMQRCGMSQGHAACCLHGRPVSCHVRCIMGTQSNPL